MFNLSKKAVIIIILTGLSYVLSFLFQIVLAGNFGAGAVLDSYFAALTLPVLFVTIFSVVLNASILPVFSETLERKDTPKEREMASSVFNSLLLISLFIVLIGEVFAPQIIRTIVPNLSFESQLVSVGFLRILLLIILFSSLNQTLSSFYLGLNNYITPSLSLLLNNLALLVSYLFLRRVVGIWGIAWAAVLGFVLQFLFLSPVLLKRKYFHLKINFKNSYFIKIFGLSWPLFLGNLIYRSNNLVERYFASGLGEGKITYLNYGYRMTSTLALIIISGIQTIGFVKFSQISARREISKLRKKLYLSLLVGFLVLSPPALITFFFAGPIIRIFLERGFFTPEATFYTSQALKFYSPIIISLALGGLASSAFYALYKTKTVVIINIGIMFLYVLLSWLLIPYFDFLGLPIAFSVTNWLQFIVYLFFIEKEFVTVKQDE